MSETFSTLSINFNNKTSAEQVWNCFQPLMNEGYKDSDAAFKAIDVKSNFSKSNMTLGSVKYLTT